MGQSLKNPSCTWLSTILSTSPLMLSSVYSGKLREAAFNHLAALKGDPEVEQYFIGYFVDVETGYESDVLTDIANSFWS